MTTDSASVDNVLAMHQKLKELQSPEGYFLVSPVLWKTLCKTYGVSKLAQDKDRAVINGMRIEVSNHMPFQSRTGEIIQRDRFATYTKDDGWAFDCGLAVWETTECHCIFMTLPKFVAPEIPLPPLTKEKMEPFRMWNQYF